MPIYEYRCAVCGLKFERMSNIGDNTTATCPNGHSNTRRVFSAPGIVFKGSGFYVTDNRSNGVSNHSSD